MKNDNILQIQKSKFKRSLNRSLTFKPPRPPNDIDSNCPMKNNPKCSMLSYLRHENVSETIKSKNNVRLYNVYIDIIY